MNVTWKPTSVHLTRWSLFDEARHARMFSVARLDLIDGAYYVTIETDPNKSYSEANRVKLEGDLTLEEAQATAVLLYAMEKSDDDYV